MAATFAAGSGRGIETSSTTVSTTIPTEAVDGSLVVACVMRRSALTPPAGWTLAVSQEHSDFDQWVDIYYKVASSDAGTSPVWTQATAGRFILHYQVYVGGGLPTLEEVGGSTSLEGPMDIPGDIVNSDRIVINATTAVYVATVGTDSYSYSNLIHSLPQPSANNRLAAGHMPRLAGEGFYGTVDFTGGDPNLASATAQFSFADGVYIPPKVVRASSQAALVLSSVPGQARTSSGAVLVLWGIASSARVSSEAILVLHRRRGRRIIGITD